MTLTKLSPSWCGCTNMVYLWFYPSPPATRVCPLKEMWLPEQQRGQRPPAPLGQQWQQRQRPPPLSASSQPHQLAASLVQLPQRLRLQQLAALPNDAPLQQLLLQPQPQRLLDRRQLSDRSMLSPSWHDCTNNIAESHYPAQLSKQAYRRQLWQEQEQE
jgi:hypothetical protein